jgi:hypothetical protein
MVEFIPHATPAQATAQSMELIRRVAQSIEQSLIGSWVRVTSEHNGQPFGRSRKSWKGQVCRIKSVYIDLQNGIRLVLEEHEYGECLIPADEVEFV